MTNVVYVVVFSDLDLITGVCQEGQIGRGLSYGSVYKQTISRQVILSPLHMDGVSTTSLQVFLFIFPLFPTKLSPNIPGFFKISPFPFILLRYLFEYVPQSLLCLLMLLLSLYKFLS